MNKFEIDNSGTKYNYGMFTTESNIKKFATYGTVGYSNLDGSKTQWGFSMDSFKTKLNDLEFNV